jgi:hypothetical protein
VSALRLRERMGNRRGAGTATASRDEAVASHDRFVGQPVAGAIGRRQL